jgi:hypothetical protein
MSIIIGIAIITIRVWLSYIQMKRFAAGVSDTLGGNISLLIVGIGLVIIG